MAGNLDAPTIIELTPGSGSVTIKFILPFDSEFTDVMYSTNGGEFWSLGATGGVVTITKESDNTTNLVNDTTYTIQLVGVSLENPLSEDTLRTPMAVFTPVGAATLPDAPTLLATTPADGAIELNFTLGDNGGSAVTAVFYTTDDGVTWAELASPLDGTATITTLSDGVTPIENDTQIAIQLVSVNAVETLPENNVATKTIFATPALATVPADIPIITGWSPGNHSLDVTYKLGSDGGSNFVSVYYSTDDGATWADTGATSGLAQILNKSDGSGALVNGDTYQVRLLVTTVDYPDATIVMNSQSERVDMKPFSGTVAPAAPMIGTYIPGDQRLTVPYILGSDGGSPVLKVYYSTDDGTTWYDTGSPNGLALITALSSNGSTPLTNGTPYAVKLVAITADFTDETTNPASTPTAIMIPSSGVTRPDVVTIDSVEAGDKFIGVSYSIKSTGGSPISNIWYSTDAGNSWKDVVADGYFAIASQSGGEFPLENGTTYYLLLVAATVAYPDYINNPIPNSATPATPVAPDTPASPPSAPSITSAGVGDKTITLSYTVGSDGGSAFTDVLYTTDGGDSWYSTGETYPFGEVTITALSTDGTTLLTNGTSYFVQLVSMTEAFPTTTNPKSDLFFLTPSASSVAPEAPFIRTASAGDAMFQIDYVLGSDGGSLVTDVQYSTNGGSDWRSTGDASGTAILTTDSQGNPLVNGTPYTLVFVTISTDFTDPNANPQTATLVLTPTAETSVPPDAPIIVSTTPGDGQVEVTFKIGSVGSGTLQGIFYSTDGTTWADTGVTTGPFVITTDSNGNPLVNDQTYSLRIVAVTSDYPTPLLNIPSEVVEMTPQAGGPVAPDAPSILSFSPGDQSVFVTYNLGSNGGSFFTNVWYSTNNGGDWSILDVGSSIATSTSATIYYLSTDGTTPLTNGVEYTIRLMTTTAAFPTPTNTPSEPVYATPSATTQRPSAPVITSWFGLDGALVVRYTIPSDGGSSVTAVYYSTDGGLTWDPTRAPNGTAVITMTSGGSGPIVDSTTYGVRLLAVTIDFPSLSNPSSPTVLMVARPTLPGTFKPKGMSYTEFLRSKKADRAKIINTKPVRTASEITNARRLAASTVFALNNESVKGSITTPIDFSQGGLHAARSYYKEGGTGRRVGSASEFTAFSGSQAIGGLVQAGLPPTRLLQRSNFILVSPPVAQGVSDYLRRDQGCKASLGQQHELTEVTPPKFVDNTIRNTGSPACVTRPAIHEIKAKNAFAYIPNRPSQAEGQYALKGDLEPGKELGAVGGNPHYKAGAALKNIPYVEKHHGNDLGVNPKRPFVKFHIPKGATPVHLKINKPVNTI